MNDNAKKWIAALRSGEFSQTRRYLRTEEGFCCMGVACELAAREGLLPEGAEINFSPQKAYDHYNHSKIYNYGGGTRTLPRNVQEWLGLASDNGLFRLPGASPNDYQQLTAINDGGATFEEIATTIESEPAGLFKQQ